MKYKITVLAGDGIGPEVMEQGLKVLNATAKKFNFEIETENALIGAVAIDQTGNPLPDESIESCKKADAILLGAVGHPKYDNDPTAKVRPEQGLLKLRKSLGLFANIRPVSTYEILYDASPIKTERIKGVDFVVFRELTGGIYFGDKGTSEDGQSAYDTSTYTVAEIDRITRLAFDTALQRKKKVCLVDKANVVETSRLWRKTVGEIAKEAKYAEIELENMFVDNAAMQLIQWPTQFDVILTENMFGDIITDEASVIPGSMGLLPSASVGSELALFEPIHGSYPQAAGKNIANPFAMVLSIAMMLEHLKQFEAAQAIKKAVDTALNSGVATEDISKENAKSTTEVGEWLTEFILKN
ncbi:MAG: 3-isopropylmalate dehydrogenase [Bacteroidetes bacterium 4572_117]|nr:MAG: 3-isopropylmalate dehydrogenase [Bacteroidetes bacterium 4572_117]